MGQTQSQRLSFTDNPAVKGREDRYETVDINTAKVLQSWRESLFSYEWMRPDNSLKTIDELTQQQQERRRHVEQALRDARPLERPVLGIGLAENVEIGAGKAVFLTLAALGFNSVSVHIPAAHRGEFDAFLT